MINTTDNNHISTVRGRVPGRNKHNTTQQYHLYYNENELNINAVNLIRRLIKEQHFFKQDEVNKLILLKQLSEDLSLIYGIKKPRDIILINNCLGIGRYNVLNEMIYLNKCSLVTFLHEYKHHLNNRLGLLNTEDSARGFSHSLYYCATPILFKKAVEKGLLIFQKSINTTDNKSFFDWQNRHSEEQTTQQALLIVNNPKHLNSSSTTNILLN